jgi:hypothetical protein
MGQISPQAEQETYFSPQEIGRRLRISADVVRIQFRVLPGVLVLGDGPRKRIRIPERVLNEWIQARVRGKGRAI